VDPRNPLQRASAVVMMTSQRASTGMMPQMRICTRGQNIANASITPNTAAEAPTMAARGANISERSAPEMPLMKYS
jgi:hypothetical protein